MGGDVTGGTGPISRGVVPIFGIQDVDEQPFVHKENLAFSPKFTEIFDT